MKLFLKRQYDGYHFSHKLTDIYNPFSLLNAFATQRVDDYWFRSGTPSYLVRLLNHTNEDLDELTGKYYDPSEFVDYKADVERPLPMIYQSGYLTIKDCDKLALSKLRLLWLYRYDRYDENTCPLGFAIQGILRQGFTTPYNHLGSQTLTLTSIGLQIRLDGETTRV